MAVQANVRRLLMFEGKAEEAINSYVSLFSGSAITGMVRYDPGGPGHVELNLA
jgi:predicted 3-demethylubiquinone-9 3-methyltransferase (glyoxalase superfamily)